jgi:hypothetical protein
MLNPPPVFILASPHSQVSLISAMLGQHPRAYAVPELNLFRVGQVVDMFDLLPPPRTHGIIRAVAQLYCGEQTLESAEAARRWLFRRALWSTGEVHRELCRKVAPLRLIDPSGLHSDYRSEAVFERILGVYPDAHFLHLVCHPRTQCEAWLRNPAALWELFAMGALDTSTGRRMPDPQLAWYRRHVAIEQFLSGIPDERKLRLRVEDVLGEPAQHLRDVMDWLGLDDGDGILDAMLHPERSAYSRPGPYGAERGSDASFLAAPHYRRERSQPGSLHGVVPWRPDGKGFLPELVELARSFGYA